MARVLIIEDDATFAQIIQAFLVKNAYDTEVASTIKQAYYQIDENLFDLILTDYRLPDGTGLDVLTYAREKGHQTPSVMMTSFNDVRTAVKAMQLGAKDFITKPINPEELLMVVKQALIQTEIKKESLIKPSSKTDLIKGKSSESEKLYAHISLVAPTDMSVIIQGESGTGKEFAAKTLHTESKRANKPFVAIDCGALSKDLAASELFGHVKGAFTGALNDKKGQFETANGGTLFLDEIGNLSYEVQVKLLRALQERVIQPLGSTKTIPVDVRIIVATNDDLSNSTQEGTFREDLYHRLNEFKIHLPPLRERGSDLALFIDHFMQLSNQELGRSVKRIDPGAKELLLQYDWPGNLRELKNTIKRMVLITMGEEATLASLPEEMAWAIKQPAKSVGTDLKTTNENNEKQLIAETLQKVKYNKTKAAKLLNIDRKTLYAKMERYGIA